MSKRAFPNPYAKYATEVRVPFLRAAAGQDYHYPWIAPEGHEDYRAPKALSSVDKALAPGWSILPGWNVSAAEGKAAGKRSQIFKLTYLGRDTGKYALTAEGAAELSHKLDPLTMKKRKPASWGKAKSNPVLLVDKDSGREIGTVDNAYVDWSEGAPQVIGVPETFWQKYEYVASGPYSERNTTTVQVRQKKGAKSNPMVNGCSYSNDSHMHYEDGSCPLKARDYCSKCGGHQLVFGHGPPCRCPAKSNPTAPWVISWDDEFLSGPFKGPDEAEAAAKKHPRARAHAWVVEPQSVYPEWTPDLSRDPTRENPRSGRMLARAHAVEKAYDQRTGGGAPREKVLARARDISKYGPQARRQAQQDALYQAHQVERAYDQRTSDPGRPQMLARARQLEQNYSDSSESSPAVMLRAYQAEQAYDQSEADPNRAVMLDYAYLLNEQASNNPAARRNLHIQVGGYGVTSDGYYFKVTGESKNGFYSVLMDWGDGPLQTRVDINECTPVPEQKVPEDILASIKGPPVLAKSNPVSLDQMLANVQRKAAELTRAAILENGGYPVFDEDKYLNAAFIKVPHGHFKSYKELWTAWYNEQHREAFEKRQTRGHALSMDGILGRSGEDILDNPFVMPEFVRNTGKCSKCQGRGGYDTGIVGRIGETTWTRCSKCLGSGSDMKKGAFENPKVASKYASYSNSDLRKLVEAGDSGAAKALAAKQALHQSKMSSPAPRAPRPARAPAPPRIKAPKAPSEKSLTKLRVAAAIAAEAEIFALLRAQYGDQVARSISEGMYDFAYDKGQLGFTLASSKYTAFEVDDPKVIKQMRDIGKKYADAGVTVTVAVRNPRY
jgi:hypothetical protein